MVMSNDDANDAAVVETCERWIANGGACAWLVSEDGREARRWINTQPDAAGAKKCVWRLRIVLRCDASGMGLA